MLRHPLDWLPDVAFVAIAAVVVWEVAWALGRWAWRAVGPWCG